MKLDWNDFAADDPESLSPRAFHLREAYNQLRRLRVVRPLDVCF
jgi:hypothetical protein